MATANNAGEYNSITSPADAAAGGTASGEVLLRVSGGDSEEPQQQTEESSAEKVKRKLTSLNKIVFCIALLEWAGNAVGTLALLWATVVLLGGFSSLLSHADFWLFTVMIFMEATRVFIRNDASVNQWLLGSTRAFRWDDFSFPHMHKHGNLIAMIVGAGISLTPVWFQPEIVARILKVALLTITSLLLTRRHWGLLIKVVLALFLVTAVCGGSYGLWKLAPRKKESTSAKISDIIGFMVGLTISVWLLAAATGKIMSRIQSMGKPVLVLCFKVIIVAGLTCLPFVQGKLGSEYTYFSLSFAPGLLALNYPEKWNRGSSSPDMTCSWEQNTATLLLGTSVLLLKIVETILPILFFWSVMFPLPGISLKVSFYMLFSVIAAVLVGNLQIPVAFLQVLLSALRLCSLLGHHQHRDYYPLPDGASPNLVPSIVVFYMLELCQGSSYVVATMLGLISFQRRRSLVRDLGFTEDWGAKAVNLYYHQAYQARTENGLFPSEKCTPSLTSFAIECLGCTSSEIQILGLRILDNFLEKWDSRSKSELITEITSTSHKAVVSSLIDMLRSTKQVYCYALNLVRSLVIKSGKVGERFRQELSENPSLTNILERILDLEECEPEAVMDIIAKLALNETARQEIGSSQVIIGKLMCAFLRPDDDANTSENNGLPLRMAAGEALSNLTIMSIDNCWAILFVEVEPEHNLIENLINMLDNEYYICVAANLLHNLCANSGDKLVELGKQHLESAVQNVMEMIMTREGKQLEAALCVASQIGYVIPRYFAQVLESAGTNSAVALVEKLLHTLSSIREPCLEYPRIRRVLIEVVISIVDLCPRYINIFREKRAKDALDMVKGTPSRLEKHRVFLGGEGVVAEILPMRDLVDKAKSLLH